MFLLENIIVPAMFSILIDCKFDAKWNLSISDPFSYIWTKILFMLKSHNIQELFQQLHNEYIELSFNDLW